MAGRSRAYRRPELWTERHARPGWITCASATARSSRPALRSGRSIFISAGADPRPPHAERPFGSVLKEDTPDRATNEVLLVAPRRAAARRFCWMRGSGRGYKTKILKTTPRTVAGAEQRCHNRTVIPDAQLRIEDTQA
jgi:hypothetical protein